MTGELSPRQKYGYLPAMLFYVLETAGEDAMFRLVATCGGIRITIGRTLNDDSWLVRALGSEGYYGKELFSRADFTRLAKALRRLKGRFLLSINDRPEVRDIFKGFSFEELSTTYTAGGTQNLKKVGELLITNA